MAAACGETTAWSDAAPGLFAQAILGLTEHECLEAKRAERIGHLTLVDCLSSVGRLERDAREKIVTGIMMLALADGQIKALEIRWASMLASAAGLGESEFQQCCASARVIATMLRPSATGAAS